MTELFFRSNARLYFEHVCRQTIIMNPFDTLKSYFRHCYYDLTCTRYKLKAVNNVQSVSKSWQVFKTVSWHNGYSTSLFFLS